jgi:AcrR family transcriptional regulator
VDPTRQLTDQGRERKQQLLECAAKLFAERGYAETRVIDIVKAAGVAKGLFYWYFENKDALFRELVETTRHNLRKAQAAAMDADADPLVQIRQGSEASVRFMAEHAHLYALMWAEGLDRAVSDLVRRGTEQHAGDTGALVRRGIAEGLIRDEDPLLLSYAVISTVGNFSHLFRVGRVATPVDELADFVGRLVVRALAVDEEIARAAERDAAAVAP